MSIQNNKAQQGVQQFNHRKFFAAHESFEDAWRETTDESREFYRALLHISAGYYRLTQNRPRAAYKFFSRALHWIDQFPDTFLGVEAFGIKIHLRALIKAIDREEPSEAILNKYAYQITLAHRDGSL